MGKVYSQGIASPKGFNLVQAEPVDQRTIVQYKADLLTLAKVYPGIKVQVLESIGGTILREYKFMGGDSSLTASWEEVTGGGGSTPPSELPLKFTSFVFKRAATDPGTPVGGDYDSPIPTTVGWFDTAPAGVELLWMSSAIFENGNTDPAVWGPPLLVEDTDSTEFIYCDSSTMDAGDFDSNDTPYPPTQELPDVVRPYWTDDSTPTSDWMGIGNRIGGVWPTTWDIIKVGGEQGSDGAQGDDGRAYKQSTVFARTNDYDLTQATVVGGSFSNPYPSKTVIGVSAPLVVSWHDGIPAGTAKLWMTNFIYNDVDHVLPSESNTWTTPGQTTDTSTDDFEFSSSVAQPADPTTDPSAWHDIATVNDIWMAHRSINNGTISAWGITKVKGEVGEAGKGLDIQGRDTIPNILALTAPPVELYDIWLASADEAGGAVPGLVNDAYLYVGAGNGDGGTAWDNIGGITGTDGASYLQSFVFIRSASTPTTPSGGSFAAPVPAGWSDTPPAGTDPLWGSDRFFSDDATINAGLAGWKAAYRVGDTIEMDYEFAALQPADAKPLPPNTAPGGTWHNDPLVTDYWMAQATKTNAVTDQDTWQIVRIRGEKGDTGSDGASSFLSSAYLKTNADISNTGVTGGSYVDPEPTSTADGKSWSDGIPAGPGAIWFSQVRFDQSDTGTPLKVWPKPTIISDTDSIEYQFNGSVSEPAAFPVEGSDGANGWFDEAASVAIPRWMAIGSLANGVWPIAWDVVSILGEKGEAGVSARTYIPSTRFARCDNLGIEQVTVSGQYIEETSAGVFEIVGGNPTTDVSVGGVTYEFTDAIPAQTGSVPNNAFRVWMIQSVFNSVDDLGVSNEMNWGNPQLMADTGGMDYEYHPGVGVDHTEPGAPGSGQTGWINQPDGNTYWIAQKNWSEGVTAQWLIYLIRGENGANGSDGTDGTDGESAPVIPIPTAPSGLFIYRDGFKERAQWSAGSVDSATTLDYYEIEETAEGLGIFTSTTLTVGINGCDGVFKPTYTFRARTVDKAGGKSLWSSSVNYTPPADNIYGYAVQVVNTCANHSPAPNPDAYLLCEEGRDLDVGGLAYTNLARTTPYPIGDRAVYGYTEGAETKKWVQFKTLSNGAFLSLDACN